MILPAPGPDPGTGGANRADASPTMPCGEIVHIVEAGDTMQVAVRVSNLLTLAQLRPFLPWALLRWWFSVTAFNAWLAGREADAQLLGGAFESSSSCLSGETGRLTSVVGRNRRA